ncbi:uncharacterized protein PGTG_08878 [Puccinia graminis f. sp. tritici CRL 75-36-700-3]|uniref:Uncharacterized protein n=1 Tax=Puccinia graminis f. sp. tritici (strain CRL 75-36-700-3 / race SCCL) TaxID=418459 RepID=E3KEE9_PUCGT|nr:uncharacterized protein PGTG_08878 [Puccinia graminis f. sp. tritici CRL 75-36-700-3]EFP82682.2 hypothetical protein PGTG_08878 [Puccinia graminis f. sp. tritici CRL 75-36-700-3]
MKDLKTPQAPKKTQQTPMKDLKTPQAPKKTQQTPMKALKTPQAPKNEGPQNTSGPQDDPSGPHEEPQDPFPAPQLMKDWKEDAVPEALPWEEKYSACHVLTVGRKILFPGTTHY